MDLAKTAMAQYCIGFVYKNTEDYDENRRFTKFFYPF